MTMTYLHVSDLAKEVQPPDKGILSRTLYNDDRLKAVAFGFAQGEELSEHTASMPAALHFLQSEAKLTPGEDTVEAKPGTWGPVHRGNHGRPDGSYHDHRCRRWRSPGHQHLRQQPDPEQPGRPLHNGGLGVRRVKTHPGVTCQGWR
jgi:hypothetical protein